MIKPLDQTVGSPPPRKRYKRMFYPATRVGPAGPHQVRKNTNHTTASTRTASPSETASKAKTDGPGSPCRASVGVSTIRWLSRVAMTPSNRHAVAVGFAGGP